MQWWPFRRKTRGREEGDAPWPVNGANILKFTSGGDVILTSGGPCGYGTTTMTPMDTTQWRLPGWS